MLPCPPPGDLLNPVIEPRSPTLQVDSLPSEPPGKLVLVSMPVPVHVSSQPSIVVKENIMVLSQSISLRNPGMPKSCPTNLPYLNTTLLLW